MNDVNSESGGRDLGTSVLLAYLKEASLSSTSASRVLSNITNPSLSEQKKLQGDDLTKISRDFAAYVSELHSASLSCMPGSSSDAVSLSENVRSHNEDITRRQANLVSEFRKLVDLVPELNRECNLLETDMSKYSKLAERISDCNRDVAAAEMARLEAASAKVRLTALTTLQEMYHADCVDMLQRLHTECKEKTGEAQHEAQLLQAKVQQYEAAINDDEYRALLEEYKQLRGDIETKEWGIKHLLP